MIETKLNTAPVSLPVEPELSYVHASWPLKTVVCLLFSDAAAVLLSLVLSAGLRSYVRGSAAHPILGTILPSVIVVICSLMSAGLYPGVCVNPVEEMRRCTIAVTLAFLSLLSATFFLHDLSGSRLVYAVSYVLAVVLVPLFRTFTRRAFSSRAWWGSQVAILGFGEIGQRLLDVLGKDPAIGLKPIAVLDDDERNLQNLGEGVIRGPLDRCLEIVRRHKISYGIVCDPGRSRVEFLEALDVYSKCFSHLLIIPDLIGMTCLGISAREVGGVVGLEIRQQLLRPSAQYVKRALDLFITIVAAPVILALVAVAAILIMLEDGGPAFYPNERVGRRGRTFRAWKLRSMVRDGDDVLASYLEMNPAERRDWELCQKLKRDPRITRIGRILRKTSIDELPQFWNVLIGDMSVVGPRPMVRQQIGMYGKSFSLYTQVRPGITGLWQVSGRNRLTFRERAMLDKYVIQNWSVWLDVYILFRTIRVVLTGHGAY